MALYLSWPAVSQICALIVLPSTCRLPGDQAGFCTLLSENRRSRRIAPASETSECSYLYTPGCKFNTDGRLRLQAKLITSEPTQQVGLSDAGVPDKYHLEEIIIAGSQHKHTSDTHRQNIHCDVSGQATRRTRENFAVSTADTKAKR